MKRTVLGVTLLRLIGLMVFLIVLGLLNQYQFDGTFGIVEFLNNHVWIIIFMSVLFYLGELFFVFSFPFNIPAPVFNAMGSIFLVGFIFDIIYTAGYYVNALFGLRVFEPFVIVIVFLLVIIFGYVKVFKDLCPKPKKKPKKSCEWEDVGAEFKMAVYNLASSVKDALEPKKKKKK